MKTNKGAAIKNPLGSYPLTFDGMTDVGDLQCGIPYIRGNGISPTRTNQMKQVLAGLNSSYRQLVSVGKGSLDLSLVNVTEVLTNLPYREYIPTGGGVIDYVDTKTGCAQLWSGNALTTGSVNVYGYSLIVVTLGYGARRTQAIFSWSGTYPNVVDCFSGSLSGTESATPSSVNLWGLTVMMNLVQSNPTTMNATFSIGRRKNITVNSNGSASISTQDTQRIYSVYGIR